MNASDQEIVASIKSSGITLKQWLNAPCLPEDFLPLPWDNNIYYLPVDVARRKFKIMDEAFGATVDQTDVIPGVHNTLDKETIIWASVSFKIYHESFNGGVKVLCGVASFLKGQYSNNGKGWAFMQIAESLATTRAFSKEYAQFGKDINKDFDSIENFKSPKDSSKKDTANNTAKSIK